MEIYVVKVKNKRKITHSTASELSSRVHVKMCVALDCHSCKIVLIANMNKYFVCAVQFGVSHMYTWSVLCVYVSTFHCLFITMYIDHLSSNFFFCECFVCLPLWLIQMLRVFFSVVLFQNRFFCFIHGSFSDRLCVSVSLFFLLWFQRDLLSCYHRNNFSIVYINSMFNLLLGLVLFLRS